MHKAEPVAEWRCAARTGRIRALRPSDPRIDDHRAALGRLLPLWPHELEDQSLSARLRIIARLRKALRAERRLGLAGHWTYDLARHVELLRLYRAELTTVRQQLGSAVIKRCTGKTRIAYFSRRVPRPICLARAERAWA
jgi:hypothetical protein